MIYRVYKDLELNFETFGVTVEACFYVDVSYIYGEYDFEDVGLDDFEITFQCTAEGGCLENLSDEQYNEVKVYLEKYAEDNREAIIYSCEVNSDDFRDD